MIPDSYYRSIFKKIFNDKKKNKILNIFFIIISFLFKVMKNSQLFLVVGILLVIDIIIMTTWQVFDPFFRDIQDLRPYVSIFFKWHCFLDQIDIELNGCCARFSCNLISDTASWLK